MSHAKRLPRRVAPALLAPVLAGLLVAGCSAGPVTPLPSGTTSSSAPATAAGTLPADGVSLRSLGFTHGPEAFSLPIGTVLTTSADQTQQVTLVISSPTPASVSAYLLRSLPLTGFTVGRQAEDAIEFSGQGWRGSFVATGAISAVTLQPT